MPSSPTVICLCERIKNSQLVLKKGQTQKRNTFTDHRVRDSAKGEEDRGE